MYEYGARWYDPAIGRFTGVDPIADQFAWVSVYNYAENEPVGSIDLHGLQRVKRVGQNQGQEIGWDEGFLEAPDTPVVTYETRASSDEVLFGIASVAAAAPAGGVAVIKELISLTTGVPLDAVDLVKSGGKQAVKATKKLDSFSSSKIPDEEAKTIIGAGKKRNEHLAGGKHPKTGVPFDDDGFPDFSNHLYNGPNDVNIGKFTGNRAKDFKKANEKAGFAETPSGYTWHHHQDQGRMQLVKKKPHSKTGHTGGHSIHKNE